MEITAAGGGSVELGEVGAEQCAKAGARARCEWMLVVRARARGGICLRVSTFTRALSKIVVGCLDHLSAVLGPQPDVSRPSGKAAVPTATSGVEVYCLHV